MEHEAELASGQRFRDYYAHLIATAAIAVLFMVALFVGFELGVGRFGAPGSGLWPVLASSGGLLVAILLMGMTVIGKNKVASAHLLFSDVSWFRVGIFICGVLAFLTFYPLVGFVIAAIPVAFLLLKFAGQASWVSSIVTAVVAPLVLYYIFSEILNVRI
ncbi:MAG: tripartite tricarboxylate transporter TctB family protein [Micrococcaceae bacterium]